MRKQATAPRDEGLRQINAWHDWFVGAHAQRLRDDGVDGDAFNLAHAAIVVIADAITQRMTDDFLRRHP